MSFFLKDPAASIDYAFDWAAGYLQAQTVTVSSWAVAPIEAGGVSVAANLIQPTRTTATLAGGVAGRVYRVTNRIGLSDGRADERTMTLRVEER